MSRPCIQVERIFSTPKLALVARTVRSCANNLDIVCEKTYFELHNLFSSGAAQCLKSKVCPSLVKSDVERRT
jgi:hypothetical protein